MYKILLLGIGTFALGIDTYIMAGLLPGISASFDVSVSGAGQTVSVFTVCYAVSAPFFGALTAGRSSRLVLATALSIFTLANASSAVSTSFDFLLVTRAAAGIGAGLYTPTALSAASGFVSRARRGRALGIVVGGLAMGSAVGVPCGLLVAHGLGWRATMWLVTALGALALAGILMRLTDAATPTAPSLRQRVAVLADPHVAATIAVSFVTSAGSIGLYTYAAPLLHASAGVADTLPFLWAWSLGGLLGLYLSGMIIDATGRPEWLLAAVLVGMTTAVLSLPWALGNTTTAVFWFACWGAAAWSTQTPQQYRLLSLHPDKGSIALALQSSAHYSGSAAGAAAGGLALGAGVSPTQLPTLAGGTLLVAFVGQVWISLLSRSGDRRSIDADPTTGVPAREAVQGRS